MTIRKSSNGEYVANHTFARDMACCKRCCQLANYSSGGSSLDMMWSSSSTKCEGSPRGTVSKWTSSPHECVHRHRN